MSEWKGGLIQWITAPPNAIPPLTEAEWDVKFEALGRPSVPRRPYRIVSRQAYRGLQWQWAADAAERGIPTNFHDPLLARIASS